MTKNSSSESSDDAATQCDPEFLGSGERLLRFFGHVPENNLVAEFIDCELTDGIWNLSSIAVFFEIRFRLRLTR